MSEKLERVKAMMVRQHRFYATLLMSRVWKEVSPYKALSGTDGLSITFDAAEAEKYTDEEVLGVLAHELMHIYAKHHLRRHGRNSDLWNEAADYIVNPILLEQGFKLPSFALVREDLKGLCVEEAYAIVQQEQEAQPSKPSLPRMDYVEDMNENESMSEAEISIQETAINVILGQALRIAKQAGQLTEKTQMLFDTLTETKTDWRSILKDYVTMYAKNDYTWSYPNKRYLHQGLYLPSLHSMEMGKLGIIIDVSGSIRCVPKLLRDFLSQVKGLLEELRTTATILCVNTAVQEVYEEVTSESIDNLAITGGGGTDFVPGFDWFNKNEPPDVVLYFTDLQCSSYPSPPDYPVIWCAYNLRNNKTVPFGTILQMEG